MSETGSYVLSAMMSFASGVLCAVWMSRRSGRTRNIIKAVESLRKEEMKMALIVRKDLKMGTGKIAAQCAHAAVAVVEETNARRGLESTLDRDRVFWLDDWLATGSAKVVLQCESESALMELYKSAKQQGLPHYVIRDAGRTQIAAGSKTVLSIGPAPKSRVDEITGSLKLL